MGNDWIFCESELRNTPSQGDGMKYKDELIARRKACDFIEKMAKPLDLPKLAQICADNYVHRFYMRHSFVRYDKYLVAAACVLLASKVEESPKKIGYVAREYIVIRKIVEKDQVFAIQKHDPQVIAGKIISMEGVVLHTLAYELSIVHPYKFINEKVDKVVRLFELSDERTKTLSGKIKQVAWSFLNDSAYTTACVRAESHELAAAAVYLAGLYDQYVPDDLCTTDGTPWWDVLGTPFPALQDAATYLLAAYADPYIKTQVLPAGLAKLVYLFHPPRSADSPNHSATIVEAHQGEGSNRCPSRGTTASPLCVTSPECGGVTGRSPFDHDFDHEVKVMPTDSKKRASESMGEMGFNTSVRRIKTSR